MVCLMCMGPGEGAAGYHLRGVGGRGVGDHVCLVKKPWGDIKKEKHGMK